ncbi:MAG: DMT family transporter [Christensenellales bacterium]
MTQKQRTAAVFAIAAAALYALSAPFSKLLLASVAPAMMAALLYLGAGIGLSAVWLLQRRDSRTETELPLTKKELPFVIAMVLLDIAAPVLLMIGLTISTAANASLLNSFEIVATALAALLFFREAISKRLWLAIALVTAASMLLSFEDAGSFSFSFGSLFVLLACVCWGFENNCTRRISGKNPLQITVIKGLFSGSGALAIAVFLGETAASLPSILAALALGFVSFGLSIVFYIRAQRTLGAAKTSAYYAVAPFIGVFLSLVIFCQLPSPVFLLALLIMVVGVYFASTEKKKAVK